MLGLISDMIAIMGLSGIECMSCALYGVQGCHSGLYSGLGLTSCTLLTSIGLPSLTLYRARIAILGPKLGIEHMLCALYGVQVCNPCPYTGQDAHSEPYIGHYACPGPYVLDMISILELI